VYSLKLETLRLFLHVLAATIWVGGQLTLAALVPVLRRAGADVPRMAAQQFGRVAWSAFGVLVLTGIWNIAAYDDSSRSGYRATVSTKLAFVVLSGLSALLHQRASTKKANAIWGAATALFALLALLWGVLLAQ
jgi:putative copper export protein